MATPKVLLATTCLLVIIVTTATASQQPALRQNEFEDIRHDDVIFGEAVVFHASARSALDCARLCGNVDGCVTFTFAEQKKRAPKNAETSGSFPLGTCRGNSDLITLGSKYRNQTKTFKLSSAKEFKISKSNWLRTSCVSGADCPANNTICHRGRWLCEPTYYFSYTTDTCVETCDDLDVGRSFLKYDDVNLDVENTIILSKADIHTCNTACLADPHCRFFLFPTAGSFSKCHTADSFRPVDVAPSTEWQLHRRSCV